ncbi:MAG: helix-turn-helix domain-containing protein [Bacilli bacterium]
MKKELINELEFHNRLQKLREEKGYKEKKKLTQRKASLEIGLSENALRNYETDRIPNLENLILIKRYYGVSYEYLLCESDEKNPNPNYHAKENKETISKIKKIIDELDENN